MSPLSFWNSNWKKCFSICSKFESAWCTLCWLLLASVSWTKDSEWTQLFFCTRLDCQCSRAKFLKTQQHLRSHPNYQHKITLPYFQLHVLQYTWWWGSTWDQSMPFLCVCCFMDFGQDQGVFLKLWVKQVLFRLMPRLVLEFIYCS